MTKLVDICKQNRCPSLKQWSFRESSIINNNGTFRQEHDCESCMELGQTYRVEKYPTDCPHIDEMKALEVRFELRNKPSVIIDKRNRL